MYVYIHTYIYYTDWVYEDLRVVAMRKQGKVGTCNFQSVMRVKFSLHSCIGFICHSFETSANPLMLVPRKQICQAKSLKKSPSMSCPATFHNCGCRVHQSSSRILCALPVNKPALMGIQVPITGLVRYSTSMTLSFL